MPGYVASMYVRVTPVCMLPEEAQQGHCPGTKVTDGGKAITWVLETEPRSSGKAPVLLTTMPSLHFINVKFVNLVIITMNKQ